MKVHKSPQILIGLVVSVILVLLFAIWKIATPAVSHRSLIPKHVTTPQPTPDYIMEIKKDISYTLPPDWAEDKKEEDSIYLVFTTKDYKSGYEITGASIHVEKIKDNTLSVAQLAKTVRNGKGERATLQDVTTTSLNGHPAAYSVECWEGCILRYVLTNNKNAYAFTYACGMDSRCNNKGGTIFDTEHYPDFMSFLQSITFK